MLRSGMINTIREAIQHALAQRLVGTEGRPAIEVKPGGLWTLRGTVAQRAGNTRREDWESGGARRGSSMR